MSDAYQERIRQSINMVQKSQTVIEIEIYHKIETHVRHVFSFDNTHENCPTSMQGISKKFCVGHGDTS